MTIDGVMLDMDGTLWDAVDTYAEVWNAAFDSLRLTGMRPITRADLLDLMGRQLNDIADAIAPEAVARVGAEPFMHELEVQERRLLPLLGGRLYPGVADTVRALSRHMPVMLVSNCGRYALESFMDYTGLRPYIACTASHGATLRPKHENIAHLAQQWHLRRPVYVGDTAGDHRAARTAGVEFVWASYGFGQPDGRPDYQIDHFAELAPIAGINLNQN